MIERIHKYPFIKTHKLLFTRKKHSPNVTESARPLHNTPISVFQRKKIISNFAMTPRAQHKGFIHSIPQEEESEKKRNTLCMWQKKNTALFHSLTQKQRCCSPCGGTASAGPFLLNWLLSNWRWWRVRLVQNEPGADVISKPETTLKSLSIRGGKKGVQWYD